MSTVAGLFKNVLQHMKCIEVRLEYGKQALSQKDKHIVGLAINKASSAINTLCGLVDSTAAFKIKKELDKADLVYIMLLTEQLADVPQEDMEELVEVIQTFIDNKYGKS
jgi:hypothetical protein